MTTVLRNTYEDDLTYEDAFTYDGTAWADAGWQASYRYITRLSLAAWRLATVDDVYGGETWWGVLAEQAQLAGQFVAGEMTAGQRFTPSVLWRDGESDALWTAYHAGTLTEGADALITVTTVLTGMDGTELWVDRQRYLTVVGIEVQDNKLQLELQDMQDARLDALYPPHVYEAATWSALTTDDAGRAIPRPVGTALKLPLVLIDTDGSTYWDFALCEYSGTAPTVLTVYRDGRIVDAAEYSTLDKTAGGITVLAVRFASEQIDYSGRAYPLAADVQTSDERNVIDEIDRLLAACGLALTAWTKSNARAYAATCQMLVDCDYGRDGQRKIRAILDDLLLIARSTLVRNWGTATGYDVIQDRGDAPTATLDQTLGDPIVIERLYSKSRPSQVSISYRPSPDDPSRMQHKISRTVTGGTEGVQEPRELRYLRDHTAADRLLCYLALREQYARHAVARLHGPDAETGYVFDLKARSLPTAGLRVFVDKVTQGDQSLTIEAREDAAAVHTYTAGTLPSDATDGYAPDYSLTPPAAPTALTITDGGSASGADRQAWSYVALSCTPPAVNWSEVWFVAVHATTGEMAMARGEASGGSVVGVLNGLRTEEVYAIKAYAVSPFGLDGLAADVIDATFIGQSATAATIIAPGSAINAPAAPANVIITSGGFAAGDDRRAFAYVTVEADLPDNAAELVFVAVHATTGERIEVRGVPDVGLAYLATLSGLRAAEGYGLEVYGVGAFSNKGAVSTSFNATAIGGGASTTSFTAPGTTLTAPNVPDALGIVSAGVATGDDRRSTAHVVCYVVPPSAGETYVEIWVRIIHNSTGETIEAKAEQSGANWWATVTGLRAGENYRAEAYAVNAYGIKGPADNTADIGFAGLTSVAGPDTASTVWTAPGTVVGLPPTPTSLAVSSSGTQRAGDGGITAWCAVSANFGASTTEVRETFFEIANNTTGEKQILRASAASGTATATFHGLRAGEDHTLSAYGVNAYGAKGTAATLSPVVANYTAAPATVASCTATQGMGRLIEVSWPAVTDADLGDYELERKVGAGAYSVVWRGKGRQYVDRSVSYGNTYTYRVRARNTSGIYSAAYATSSGVAPTTGTVSGGSSGNDIGSSTVATGNRTGVTTVSGTVSYAPSDGLLKQLYLTHSLGKVPVGVISSVGGSLVSSVVLADSSSVTINSVLVPSGTMEISSGAAGAAHTHYLHYEFGAPANYTVAASLW